MLGIAIRVIFALGGAFSMFRAVDNVTGKPAEAIKQNILPLALIAAGTFLAFRAMQKAKVA